MHDPDYPSKRAAARPSVPGRAVRDGQKATPEAMAKIATPEWTFRLVDAARRQIGVTTLYDPTYTRIPYPGGDVAQDRGVCTDVVIRAYRHAFRLDLQKLVHEDMLADFSAYPKAWGLKSTDPNIDHRRVPNLAVFFERRGGFAGRQRRSCRLSAGRSRHPDAARQPDAYRHRLHQPLDRGTGTATGHPQYRPGRPRGGHALCLQADGAFPLRACLGRPQHTLTQIDHRLRLVRRLDHG